jgi:hypothetical protein
VLRRFEEAFDELSPPEVAEQVLCIIIGVEVPLFPLAVLMAEFAHLVGIVP